MTIASDRVCTLIVTAAAIAVAVVAVVQGTWAVGGSDSACYGLMARSFAAGKLQPSSRLAGTVPWPRERVTLAPAGFIPSPMRNDASSPICAPGFSLLLAPFALFGTDGIFLLMPVAGALLTWCAASVARRLAGPPAGAAAALVAATSPIVLYQVVQPMNDVTGAMLWVAAVGAASSPARFRLVIAGTLTGVALLVRPNLFAAAVLAALVVPFIDLDRAPGRRALLEWLRRAAVFGLAVLPWVLIVAWFNTRLYGGPLRSGYGNVAALFSASYVPLNIQRYAGWWMETHTPFALLALAAPFVLPRRPVSLLALGIAAAIVGLYLWYEPFREWWYLRFLIAPIVLCVALASAVIVAICRRLPPAAAVITVAGITLAVALFQVRVARTHAAFDLDRLERRFRETGMVARDRLPPNAVFISSWSSGTLRFYDREIVMWDSLDPAWLDRAVSWLAGHGYRPLILVERQEEPVFRELFAKHGEFGGLDWPPIYDIDRQVRIFDPADRARYLAGQRVATEHVWRED